MNDTAVFEAHRDLMFAVAYRLLGSVADAEDVVQDAWLSWSAEPRGEVTNPKAYLARVVTNGALNRLRAARARRESYIGPWLPEPVLTHPAEREGDRAEVAESVSTAMLVVLESLSPPERAVFVLREVFGFGHAEIAAAVGRSEAAVRQLAHRAREHVQARRPRFGVDRARRQQVTERFLAAAAGGDFGGLMQVLAPDVLLITDGGGKARAALRPITGADRVARFLASIGGRPYQGFSPAEMTVVRAEINGGPGVLLEAGGGVIAAATLLIEGDHVRAIYLVANPDKLAGVATGRAPRL
jgi:RNA polymerase sigma-70 factor (TIGR02957 family)